jgi:hypothetical protein
MGPDLTDEGTTGAGDSNVRDLRIGAVGDGGGEAAGLGHRSRTDDFRPLAGRFFSVGAGDGVELSSCELTLTIFWTKPRPCSRDQHTIVCERGSLNTCSRLRLGVGSF